MDLDNHVGIDCGSGGQAEWRGAKGEKLGNCNRINNKICKLKIITYHMPRIVFYHYLIYVLILFCPFYSF